MDNNNLIIDKVTDLYTDNIFEVFSTQGEKACRNLLVFLGWNGNQIDITISILKGEWDYIVEQGKGEANGQ